VRIEGKVFSFWLVGRL